VIGGNALALVPNSLTNTTDAEASGAGADAEPSKPAALVRRVASPVVRPRTAVTRRVVEPYHRKYVKNCEKKKRKKCNEANIRRTLL
jgi:hypothetical protein